MITITCARAACRRVKAVRKKGQIYCSHRCDLLERGAEQLRQGGQRGGRASGQRRWAQALSDWQALYPSVPPELAREIYLRGYNAGWQALRAKRKRIVRAA